jgi:osmotically-inducible protein OsmY
MPDVTLTPVRKFSAKARKTASSASAMKTASSAQGKALKTASKAQTRAIATATKAQMKAATTAARVARRPVGRRDKALASAGRIAGTGTRVATIVVGVWCSAARSNESTRRPRRAAKTPRIAAVLAGAGAQFLLDPVNGKRRRRMLKDRGSAAIRDLARQGNRRAQHLAGVATGKAHEATATPSPPADDNTLADRVRTEVFRRADAPKGAVNVSVVDGVVHLHGELSSLEQIERLIGDATGVPGVRGVESSLHLPGVGAPSGSG